MSKVSQSNLSMADQVRLAAENEVKKEFFDKAKDELKKLYRQREQAREVLRNVEHQIELKMIELDDA